MSIDTAVKFLLSHDNYEILTHAYPDGDTLGSGFGLCLALQQLGKNARVVYTNLPKDFVFLTEGVKEQSFEAQTVVSVDVAGEKLLGSNKDKYQGKIDLCIDHHRISRIEAPVKYVDPEASANCEMLFEMFKLMDVELTPQIANCLYTGISTDTGCFKYSNTTSKTLRIAADLLDTGIDAPLINKVMFDTKTKKKIKLEQEIYSGIEYYSNDRCAIITVTREMMKRLGINDDDLEGLASIPRQIEGVMIGITMREKENAEFKVSVRTDRRVNAAEFCTKFGGGGHAEAAGCSVKGTLEDAKAQLKRAVDDVL